MLTATSLRDTSAARALTYVEVTTLTREALDEVIDDFPASKAQVRRAALCEAVRKATDLISRHMESKKERGGAAAATAAKAAGAMAAAMGAGSSHSAADDATAVLRMINGMQEGKKKR